MSSDKRVRKLVEAIALIELAREVNAKAKDALNEAFVLHVESGKAVLDYHLPVSVGVEQFVLEEESRRHKLLLQVCGHAGYSIDALLSHAKSLLANEDFRQESNRQAWENAASGMSMPPFAEGEESSPNTN